MCNNMLNLKLQARDISVTTEAFYTCLYIYFVLIYFWDVVRRRNVSSAIHII